MCRQRTDRRPLLIQKQILICIAAITAQYACGCDGYTRLEGTVVDSHKVPVVEAKVVLVEAADGEDVLRHRDEATTDAEGHFVVGFGHAPLDIELELEVSKPAFKTQVERFRASAVGNHTTIVLVPTD